MVEKVWYAERHKYQSNRQPWRTSNEATKKFQLMACYNLVIKGRKTVYQETVGYSRIYPIMNPANMKSARMDCMINAKYVANILGSERAVIDLEKTGEPLWEHIVIWRQHKRLPEGQKPKPYAEPKPIKGTTSIKTARNGRRYIPLQREGLNYAWRDIKTGVVYSNGTYARVLNKEGADQSKAKPMKVKNVKR
jgi:hypothetical protein